MVRLHGFQFFQILQFDIGISVAPNVTAIATSLRSSSNHFAGNALQIVGPAKFSEEVDKLCWWIPAITCKYKKQINNRINGTEY